MMDKFNALSLRERVLLIIMLALLGLFFLLQLMIMPLTRFHQKSELAQIKAQKERVFVEQNISALGQTSKGARSELTRASLVSLSRAAGIERLNRIQPQPNGDLKLWLDDVPASSLFSFLQNVEQQYVTQVTGAQITRGEGQFISAQISFSMGQDSRASGG